jgi:Signal transduction histidine kinase
MLNKNKSLLLKKLTSENEEFATLIHDLQEDYQYQIAQIVHEISNPLTLINSSIQFIQSHHPEVNNFQFWPNIQEDIHYLRLLLTNLSTFNNSDKVHLKKLYLEEILTSLRASIDSYTLNSSKKLIIQCSNTPQPIIGDAIKLRQLLINIIKNAFEALQDTGTVTISISYSKTHLILSIIDTGVGMNEEQLKNIYTPFVTTKSNGSGLGLCITKNIIDSHNGTIKVSSHENCGTTFEIMLPLC